MTALDKFHAHHEKLIQQINSLGDRVLTNPADASLLISYCNEKLIPHAEAEEKILYVEIVDEPLLKSMIREHGEIKSKLEALGNALIAMDGEEIVRECSDFLDLLKEHFDEEENKLIPKLKYKLSEEEFLHLIEKVHVAESNTQPSDLGKLYEVDHRRIDYNMALFKNSSAGKENAIDYYHKFRDQLLQHIELEEKVLFPALSKYGDGNKLENIERFINGHKRILSILSTLPKGPEKLNELLDFLAMHSKAEEDVYSQIIRFLPPEKRQEIFKESFAGFSQV